MIKKLLFAIFLIALLSAAVYFYFSKTKNSPNNQYYKLTNSVDTSNWKITEIIVPENPIVIGYRIPQDWTVELSDRGGHPNYAILRGPENDQCILFSRYMSPDKTEDQLKFGEVNVLVDKNYDGTDTTVANIQERDNIQVNGNMGILETVVKTKNEFMVAALNLGKSKVYADLHEYVVLSTCTNKESAIFTNVVNSVMVSN